MKKFEKIEIKNPLWLSEGSMGTKQRQPIVWPGTHLVPTMDQMLAGPGKK